MAHSLHQSAEIYMTVGLAYKQMREFPDLLTIVSTHEGISIAPLLYTIDMLFSLLERWKE